MKRSLEGKHNEQNKINQIGRKKNNLNTNQRRNVFIIQVLTPFGDHPRGPWV